MRIVHIKMAAQRLSLEEKVDCVRLYSATNNYSEVKRRMAAKFGTPGPSLITIKNVNKKFDETGSVEESKRSRPKTVVTDANKVRLQNELASSQEKDKSQRRLSARLDISRTSIQRILKDLKLRPYHPRLTNHLLEDDPDRRLEFAETWLAMLEDDPELARHVEWSDEAKFHVSGYVNRHNCVYWRATNPHIELEVDNQSPGVMVWAGVSYDGLLGPFFFEDTVTGDSYRDLLVNTVHPLLTQRDDFDTMWWQQDGAPPHYALTVRSWLDQTFPGRWIGRRGPVEWPPRSPDLTPLDFWLWGYLKDKVYRHRIHNIPELRAAITEEFRKIPLDMCKKACDNVKLRLEACIAMEGRMVDHSMENRV